MLGLERQNLIMQKLDADNIVYVSRLAEELEVTEETIRRDLEKLEKKELLVRTHGGALPVESSSYELSLEKRKYRNVEAKQKLAVIAASYIVSGDTVFLDASTTTFYVAKEIKKLKNVTVVTNSLRVISELSNCDDIKVIAIGGLVSGNQSLVGAFAEDAVENHFYVGKMFFSSKGIVAETGILESNEDECGIKMKMLQNSTDRFYICDKSKINKVGFAKLAAFNQIEHIITEEPLPESFSSKIKDANIEVITL